MSPTVLPQTPLCNTCPEIECVFAEGEYSIPEDTTICARTKPRTNVNIRDAWGLTFALGRC